MDKDKMKQLQNDPSFTIEVKNPEVEKLIEIYSADKTAENLNKLIDRTTRSRFLVPAEVTEENKPSPLLLTNKEGATYLPIYTSKEQLPKEITSPGIINMPFLALNRMVAKKDLKVDGIVFNPFSHNLIFKKPLVEKIDSVESERMKAKGAQKTKTVQMTPQQYVIFERSQFENIFLPTKLYESGKEFMDKLSQGKEKLIDELYEQSYQQTRMYPYMEEDFSVMAMQISEELLVIRVDFPTRDMSSGCSIRAYLVWDDSAKKASYFLITATQDKSTVLVEIDESHRKINHGPAPVEGAELQTVIDIAGSVHE